MSLDDKILAAEDPERSAREAGLRYVLDDAPGITRRRRGKGWSYYDPRGKLIGERAERERLNALAIPPAWTDVWISPHADAHLLATGRDAEGRKQYRYHPDWRAIRDESKYARMIPFARALPEIRGRVDEDLGRRGLPREKVLAAVVCLLELSLIRVGNEEYARSNGSYGLTTMRDKHVDIEGSTIRFEFRGKGGKRHEVDVRDRRLARIVRQCRDVPGYELFQYYDEDGEKHAIGSEDVNEYLGDCGDGEFTAKDFRTWWGTLHAAAALLGCEPCDGDQEGRRRINEAADVVADRLGNTREICKACYIHPAVFERYLAGALGEDLDLEEEVPEVEGLAPEEQALLRLLDRHLDER
ncbi:MAG TPA: DNA topoisomerase IB [Gemmatimonadota bacterium]|nr:DNA topoisomerase IB [Gemmatimonadota bacterium]